MQEISQGHIGCPTIVVAECNHIFCSGFHSGSLHEFPYNDESEIFDTERVMASLDAQ